ncbi:MAG TPA: TetR family transcriptional regulator [Nocardioidaceae bacterium]|jgi:AcrR family transcriptional regulator|nr:TetR family transcriptional regulator [Nocardioidaceae bacterium]
MSTRSQGQSSARSRGRRPAGSGTREAIERVARRQFAELGYPGTTMRGIAQEAGVDPRLVGHFFGSKQQLFVEVVELPFDPETVFDRLLDPGAPDLGRRLAGFVLGLLEDPRARNTVTGVIRAAASEKPAAEMVREMITTRLLLPLARRVGGTDPELRAALLGSQIVGLAFVRHVVGVHPLAQADRDRLVAAIAPVLDHYLTGPLPDPS